MKAKRWSLMAFALLAAPACNDDTEAPPPDAGAIHWSLSLTHAASLEVDPGARVPLQAFYSNSRDGGLGGESITFRIVGSAQGGQLTANAALTDDSGFAAVEFMAPLAATNQPIQVEVAAAKLSAPLYVQIQVVAPRLRILPIGPAEREARTEMSLPVQVLVERVGGGPVEGIEVVAVLRLDGAPVPEGYGLNDSGVGQVLAVTGASGMARFDLVTGPADADLRVDVSQAQAGMVNFLFHVRENGLGPRGCRHDSDCGPGFICEREGEGEEAQYVCVPADDGGCDPITPRPGQCPDGYTCDVNGECIPGGSVGCRQVGCPEDFLCRGNICVRPCVDDEDCPLGLDCLGEICQEGDPPVDIVLIEGRWETRYQFDLSEVLGFLGGLGGPLDFIDQAFRGNLDIGIPLIGGLIEDAIEDLLARYVPPWVPDLVHALNILVHIFEELQVVGEMEVSHRPNPLHVRGTEVWEHAVIHLIDRCPLGRQDPNWPTCAEVDIIFDQQIGDFGTIGTDVPPFSGRVYLDADQNWHVRFNREVNADLVGLVRYVVNLVISIATNGRFDNLPDALEAAIDCAGVQRAADQVACDLSGGRFCRVPGVEAMCQDAVRQAGQRVDQILGQLGIGWTAMDFLQDGQVYDDDNDLLADELGRWPHPAGTLDGRFRAVLNGPMEGIWHADR
jgi:hypothetical protein